MNIEIGDKALITTEAWFYAPDGRQYKALHGTVKALRSSDDTLGIRTNARSTNWYIEVGNMTIAGCQVNYLTKTDSCNFGSVLDYQAGSEGYCEFTRPSSIYDADQ